MRKDQNLRELFELDVHGEAYEGDSFNQNNNKGRLSEGGATVISCMSKAHKN